MMNFRLLLLALIIYSIQQAWAHETEILPIELSKVNLQEFNQIIEEPDKNVPSCIAFCRYIIWENDPSCTDPAKPNRYMFLDATTCLPTREFCREIGCP